MADLFASSLSVITQAFAEPVDYMPDDVTATIADLSVIWSDVAGDVFAGPGNTTRTVTAEIDFSSVPGRPTEKTRILRKGVVWAVIQVTNRDDVHAWAATLERV